eukprot:532190_1
MSDTVYEWASNSWMYIVNGLYGDTPMELETTNYDSEWINPIHLNPAIAMDFNPQTNTMILMGSKTPQLSSTNTSQTKYDLILSKTPQLSSTNTSQTKYDLILSQKPIHPLQYHKKPTNISQNKPIESMDNYDYNIGTCTESDSMVYENINDELLSEYTISEESFDVKNIELFVLSESDHDNVSDLYRNKLIK